MTEGKTKVALITTTINVPINLRTYVDHVPDHIELDVVVAGDKKTPHECQELVEGELGGTYLSTTGGNVERWKSHEMIGFNSIQRRNLALLHALANGAEFIITVDDDNVPVSPETYFKEMLNFEDVDGHLSTSTGWWNPGVTYDYESDDEFIIRGFPLDQRHVGHVERTISDDYKIGVVQGATVGDPDIDAIERIVRQSWIRPDFEFEDLVLAHGTWAPFNSQNTGYVRELAPLMQMMSGIGRYDDIWASYIARHVMDHLGWNVKYGYPVTFSERNEHDLVTDLERELYGYRHTPEFVKLIRDIDLSYASSVIDALSLIYNILWANRHDLIPPRTVDANFAWFTDVQIAMREGEAS